ncbi:phage tail protein I [Psychrobacillus sp. FSL K6-2365]|uniref:phage tail protein I n=1 Tax=Psychrobacillus sp. FSL K6-2365 TaxID=2921546 RepID=UPI0030F95400
MINIKESRLYDLLPTNLRDDKDIVAAALAIDKSTNSINSLIEKLNFRSNPEIQDDYILDALAADMHVDYYDKSFSPEIKRKIIDNSMILHTLKGTPGSVERALATVNLDGVIQEWWEYDGDPYHFQVEIEPFTTINFQQVNKLINEYKNLRSWFDGFIISFRETIILSQKTYHFEVPYQICNTFETDEISGMNVNGNLTLESLVYEFDVGYLSCNNFYTGEVF